MTLGSTPLLYGTTGVPGLCVPGRTQSFVSFHGSHTLRGVLQKGPTYTHTHTHTIAPVTAVVPRKGGSL